VKLAADLSGSHEWKLKMQLINGIHELQISCAHGSRKVIKRSSADSQGISPEPCHFQRINTICP
jgi:hypothetical protein